MISSNSTLRRRGSTSYRAREAPRPPLAPVTTAHGRSAATLGTAAAKNKTIIIALDIHGGLMKRKSPYRLYNWLHVINNDLIYQQLCFSDTNWLGCDDIYGDEDYPDYAYPYSVFDDVGAVFGITKNGLFIQFQNYSIGSYAQGAPRIIVPFTTYKMFSNNLLLRWKIIDLECEFSDSLPTTYEPQKESVLCGSSY